MEYTQAFDSYDDFRTHLKEVEGQYVRSRPYVDFGRAVFGYHLFPLSSGLGSLEVGTSEYVAAVEAAMSSASLFVWKKFGRELTEIPVTFGTLAELNAIALVDPPLVTYRLSGIPSAVDYKDAASGVSRTYTVDLAGYRKTDRALTSAAMRQYRALDWQFLIGAMDSSLMPPVSPSLSLSVARPIL